MRSYVLWTSLSGFRKDSPSQKELCLDHSMPLAVWKLLHGLRVVGGLGFRHSAPAL